MPYIIVGLIAGGITAALASGKNRSPVGWFFIGFLFPLLGLILVLVLPKGEGSGGLVDPSLDPYSQPMPANVGAAAAATAPKQALTPVQQIEKLTALHAQGALTDAEFEEKKQVFLDRIV